MHRSVTRVNSSVCLGMLHLRLCCMTANGEPRGCSARLEVVDSNIGGFEAGEPFHYNFGGRACRRASLYRFPHCVGGFLRYLCPCISRQWYTGAQMVCVDTHRITHVELRGEKKMRSSTIVVRLFVGVALA